MTSEQEPMTQSEYFLELELAELWPDFPAKHEGNLRKWIWGPSARFVEKHHRLHERLMSGVDALVAGHLGVEGMVNHSIQARTELQELGIDPQVFLGAYAIAEAGDPAGY